MRNQDLNYVVEPKMFLEFPPPVISSAASYQGVPRLLRMRSPESELDLVVALVLEVLVGAGHVSAGSELAVLLVLVDQAVEDIRHVRVADKVGVRDLLELGGPDAQRAGADRHERREAVLDVVALRPVAVERVKGLVAARRHLVQHGQAVGRFRGVPVARVVLLVPDVPAQVAHVGVLLGAVRLVDPGRAVQDRGAAVGYGGAGGEGRRDGEEGGFDKVHSFSFLFWYLQVVSDVLGEEYVERCVVGRLYTARLVAHCSRDKRAFITAVKDPGQAREKDKRTGLCLRWCISLFPFIFGHAVTPGP
ncbi:hypothetical protein BJ166DRAFT_57325 [Pestalotiopsis sp. NC0098]|nr:hypothetical protein BJ166DRAFT_57325 [Pestalotiopsis sp. NC0098]